MRMIRPSWQYFFLAICIAGAVHPAFAQRKSMKQYVHETWTSANGLPQNGSDDIIQSRDGYLWFATQEGVARFDGVKFSVINRNNTPSLQNAWVVKLLEDSSGGIWMRPQGRNNGVLRYADGHATAYGTANGLPSDNVTSWANGAGSSVWLGTTRGLAEWNDGKVKSYSSADGLPGDLVIGVGRDSKNNIWVSTTHGLARLSNGKFELLTSPTGIPDTIIVRINGVTNIFEDSRGTVWMSSRGFVISYADGQFHRYGTSSGLPDSVVFAISEDLKGTIWFGTRQGLARFDNGKITAFTASTDPQENQIRGIAVDREGSLWLKTNGGVARYASGRFERLTHKDGLTGNQILGLTIDREGSIWIGSNGGGVDRLRDGKFVTFSSRVGLGDDYTHSVYEDKTGALWVGTGEGGATRMKDGVMTTFTTKNGLPSNGVRGFGEDHQGNLWIWTEEGICTYTNGVFTTRLKPGPLWNFRLDAMFVRRSGEVLVVTRARGIFEIRGNAAVRYQPLDSLFHTGDVLNNIFETESGALWFSSIDTTYRYHHGRLSNLTTEYHLPPNGANAATEYPDGTIWMTTFGGGILRLRNGSFARITPAQGVFDYNGYSFIEDKSGYAWISGNSGVFRVNIQDLNDVADGKKLSLVSTVYGTPDGMESRECNATGFPSACRLRDGRIAFTTIKGVSIVNPEDIRNNTIPPPVVIDKFIVEGVDQETRGVVQIPAGKSRIEFQYAGLSFVGAEKIQYKFQLVGFDKGWIEAGGRREASYTHLDPGDYTFRVIAANSDGVWNETGASVGFVLQPHFYQTAWFLVLVGLIFVTSGPSYYFYRMRSMKRRREELEKQVSERTSELQRTLDNLKDTQNQLILSEKMASLGQLTAGIAHEIKNPLNFITNFAVLSHDLTMDLRKELAAERTHVDPNRAKEIEEVLNDLEQNVNKINEHGKRADSIVRGMLLHSRGKSGERQDTDLNALLAEYANLAYHGMRAQDQSFNVKIITDLDPTIGNVRVVPQDLSRAFLNIVNNACYAANDKRRQVANGFSPEVHVSAKNLGENVEIRIRDNGNGIPLAIREKVFNPFFTTKPAGVGTGLGLSLSYDIITQVHGGELSLKTEDGKFTEFIITLPKEKNGDHVA
jgi:signal transduction histidine kinase/ligand-binding sensor domain-containing protein